MALNIISIRNNRLSSLSSIGYDAGNLFCHILALFFLHFGFRILRGLDALDTKELCLEDCQSFCQRSYRRERKRDQSARVPSVEPAGIGPIDRWP